MPQTSEIVAHPETGLPVKQVTTIDFQDVEKTQLQADVENAQNAVNDKQAQAKAKHTEAEQADKELAEAEAALQDSKSNVEVYDQLTPEAKSDTGSAATSSTDADTSTEGSQPTVDPTEPQF